MVKNSPPLILERSQLYIQVLLLLASICFHDQYRYMSGGIVNRKSVAQYDPRFCSRACCLELF